VVCCRRGANICSCCIKCLLHLAISRMGSQVVGKVKAFRKLEPIRTIFSLIGQDFAREFTFRECKAKGQPIHTVCASCPSIITSLIPSRLSSASSQTLDIRTKKVGGGEDAFDLQRPACASSETGLARSNPRPGIGYRWMLEKNRFSL
jgi:hypothetical protein